MARVKKNPVTKTVTKTKAKTRLKQTEQVRDRKKNSTAFGSSIQTYQRYSRASISQIRELLFSTIWAEVCIDTIVDEVIKHQLYTDNKPDSKIDTFLKYPSDSDPLFMLRRMYLKDMLRWGNGACLIQYKKSKPVGLVVTPGYTLRVTDEEPRTYKLLKIGSDSVFKQDENGEDLVFQMKEVMHFCINRDSDSTLAPSPVERMWYEILADKESSQKFAEFIKRGFYKPSFLSFKKGSTVNKKELLELIEYLNGLMVEGAKMLGINKEVDLKEIPFWDTKDMIDSQKWIGLKIASVYKVPPFMLNLVQDVGSLNAREQKARFLENVVMPILEYEAFTYSNILVRKGFRNLDTEVTSNVLGTKLNYDRARIANMLAGINADGTQESILTIDEARKMFFNLQPKSETKKKK